MLGMGAIFLAIRTLHIGREEFEQRVYRAIHLGSDRSLAHAMLPRFQMNGDLFDDIA